jgi:hypothetical protein
VRDRACLPSRRTAAVTAGLMRGAMPVYDAPASEAAVGCLSGTTGSFASFETIGHAKSELAPLRLILAHARHLKFERFVARWLPTGCLINLEIRLIRLVNANKHNLVPRPMNTTFHAAFINVISITGS